MTGRTGQAKRDRQNRTGRIGQVKTGQAVQDWQKRYWQDRTLRTGLPRQGSQDRAARTGLPGEGCQDRAACQNRATKTGLPGQGCKDRTARIRAREGQKEFIDRTGKAERDWQNTDRQN